MYDLFDKEPIRMINEYTIYGERHSGTNFMQSSMRSFFPAVSFNERYGGKHWLGFCDEEYLRFSNHLFLCCTRNPYDWILSFYAYPHCIPIRNLQSLEDFMFNEWISYDDPPDYKLPYPWSYNDLLKARSIDTREILYDWNFETLNSGFRRFCNIFELRKVKLRYLFNLRDIVKSYELIKYEDMLTSRNSIMKKLENKYSLDPINGEAIHVPIDKNKKEYTMTKRVREMINNNIDWDVENTCGYFIKEYST